MACAMSSFAHSPHRRPMFEESAYHADASWRHEFNPHTSMLTQQWPHTHMPHMSGIQHLDVRLFGEDEQQQQQQHYPDLTYTQHDAWSDMETVGTPSTSGYTHESPDSCFNTLPAVPIMHLQLPEQSTYILPPTASPRSSYGSVSPTPSPMSMPLDDRAASIRQQQQIPTPDTRTRKIKASPSQTPGLMGELILGGEDEADYLPTPNNDAKRGRKRARIPHTAVERRYRENLNAHLDKLRQNVPALAARKGPEVGKLAPSSSSSTTNGGVGGENVKPSKCEILNGAIEHIGSLGRENEALRNEVTMLRAKVGEFDAWCRANMR